MDLSPLSKIIPSWGAQTLEGFEASESSMLRGERVRGSNRQYVRFYNKTFVEPTSLNGKTTTRDVVREMVEIITPGDKNTVDDFAQEWHRREYFPQWRAYRNGTAAPVGTSIDECSFISAGIATELRFYGIHTLEQFADSSDDLVNRVPSGWELREYAKAMVAAASNDKNGGKISLLQTQLEKSNQMIQELQEQMKGMLVSSQGEPISAKRSPGRPRKDEIITE